jgi:hypothetical protein
MERLKFNLPDYLYYGDWDFLKSAVNNKNNIFIYDIDGILINSTEPVFSNFNRLTGLDVRPTQIDGWDSLTNFARANNLSEELVLNAEDGWYDEEVLKEAQRYLYIKPVVRMTIGLTGQERNCILTSRNPNLRDVTIRNIRQEFPFFLEENIYIRSEAYELSESAFKAQVVSEKSVNVPWVILFEDSTKYVERVLLDGPDNCIVINVPLGKIRPNFVHERLFVVGRYPDDKQGMYPLYKFMKEALGR